MKLIDAEKLFENPVWRVGGNITDPYAQGYMDGLDAVEKVILGAPTITPESLVKRGEWIEDSPYRDEDGCLISQYYCSICGRYEDEREPFCNCGAKMTED